MERQKNTQEFLHLIPPQILARLEPYRGRLDEISKRGTDTSHLRFHTLDEKFILRFCDRKAADMRNEINRAVLNGNMTIQVGDQFLSGFISIFLEMDTSTFDRIDRGIELHDRGRNFVELGILKPEEHHFGSLFFALMVDGDPVICNAVLNHVQDVLPENASIVSRCVRDIDRVAGSGYIGLIRLALYQNFHHPTLEEKNEDEIINHGLMMTAQNRHGYLTEDLAEKFFWDEVFPFFESKGEGGMKILRASSKIILDRIYGRDLRGKKLNDYDKEVLEMDNNALVVEPVLPDFQYPFKFKYTNTLKVMIRARGAKDIDSTNIFNMLTDNERRLYSGLY